MRRIVLATTLLGFMAGLTSSASAAEGILPTEAQIKKKTLDKEGWHPKLSFGASVAVASNSNVVGQVDGSSWTLGFSMLGGLDYRQGVHDWINTLSISEVFTRTPIVDEFVKSADVFTFESIYYMRLSEMFGPFASFKLDSSLFEGTNVQSNAVDFSLDGDIIKASTTSIKLTDSFQPLALKEAIGAFYKPITTPEVAVAFRAGFGATQVFADGSLVLADDGGTANIIELAELSSFSQAGAVIAADITGTMDDGRVSYGAKAEVLFPFINDDAQDRSVIDLTNYDFSAKLSFKLFEWASLNYEIKALLQPELIEEWQVQNNLLLTFNYSAVN
ncbi:MAG: hypothetical protein ACI9MR_001666 [Myxococcota bacterium]|jgi:hypothetical protein